MERLSKIDQSKYEELVETEQNEEKGFYEFQRWKCRTDLYFLTSEILGLGNIKRGVESGIRMGKRDALLDPKFHRWLFGLLEKYENCLILVARGHLKSAAIKCLIVQDIIKNPKCRIHLYSITQAYGEAQLVSIKQHLETPMLQFLFPEIIPPRERWEKDVRNQLTIKRVKAVGEIIEGNQVEVYGVGNTITGRRATHQYFDDLIDKETVRTLEGVEKTRQWFSGAMPVYEAGGVRKMIGTPYHYNDLYATIQRDKIFDKVYVRPIKEHGKFVYKWWTEKKYKEVTKGMTEYDKSCQYLLNPMPIEDMAFPPPHPTYKTLPDAEFSYYMAVDPAATTAKYSDETAIIIAAVTSDGEVYITNELHGKWKGDDTAKRIIDCVVRFKPRKVGIEYGLQQHLKYIIDAKKSDWEDATKQILPLYVEPIPISRTRSKFDRVQWTFGAFAREGKVHVHESCVDLLEQMSRFNKNYTGKDDLVDATSMIFQLVEFFSYRHYTKQEFEYKPKDYFVLQDIIEKPTTKAYEDLWVQ